jgi:hypothetical protein
LKKEKRFNFWVFFLSGDLSRDFGGLIGLIEKTIYEK